MCLLFRKNQSKPKNYSKAFKFMKWDGSKWVTPFLRVDVPQNGIMDDVLKDCDIKDHFYNKSFSRLDGGAIHCYRTKKAAISSFGYSHVVGGAVFEVKGTKPVAWNNTEIAFKKIKFVENPHDYEMV